jgi:N-terminal domain of NWD NACHT-NTPase
MLTCKVFVNPTTEAKANRNSIVHVISRMKRYCELSILLLKENTVDVETSAGVRGELEQRVIDLYQALLLYLIKSVGSCYRNRLIAFLRDTIKLDD